MLANYCARLVGYNMTGGWGQGSRATIDYFRPIETYATRFEQYLSDVRAMGFDAIDMWADIMGLPGFTQEHVAITQELFRKYNFAVCSYAGGFGSTREEFTSICELAVTLGIDLLGGSTTLAVEDRNFVIDTLKKHNLRLGLENHPESPEEMLAKIGDGGDGTIGTAVDTGWYGTHGIDAAEAIERLAPYVFVVHLKDVRQVGAHNTCRYSDGVVPVERCVRVLQDMGYTGSISVEHQPDIYDPTQECIENLQMLKGWLGSDER